MKLSSIILSTLLITSPVDAQNFDADGNIIDGDASVKAQKDQAWSDRTKRNVEVMEGLKRQSPTYQQGFYGAQEQMKQEKIEAAAHAVAQKEAFKEAQEERKVRAMESMARQRPQVNIRIGEDRK